MFNSQDDLNGLSRIPVTKTRACVFKNPFTVLQLLFYYSAVQDYVTDTLQQDQHYSLMCFGSIFNAQTFCPSSNLPLSFVSNPRPL